MDLNLIEGYLENKILPELEKGRPNWDKPHTEAVVEYIKAIVDNSPEYELDKAVLVVAAYAHDWGYAGLFENGEPVNIDMVNSAKVAHMTIGAEKIRGLMNNEVFNSMTMAQKERAAHLVLVHDNLETLKDDDEFVLMEADTLGGLDIEKVKPSFDNISNESYMRGVVEKRYPRFLTNYGKSLFDRLYKSRERYYSVG